jgi:hypothetical protein
MLASNISNNDRELVGKAFKNLTTDKQRRVTKHAAGHFGCGKMMQIWKFQDHTECLRCPEHEQEDPIHIQSCPAPLAMRRWEKALTVLATIREVIPGSTLFIGGYIFVSLPH